MSRLTYQSERLSTVIEDIKPMLEAHYAEICAHPDLLVLDPDWERYLSMDEAGLLHIYTARDGLDLVGYCITVVAPNLHYRQTLQGYNDVLYLDPAYRGGLSAVRLLKGAIADLASCGVQLVSVHMKIAHPFRRLLEALGFKQIEELWEVRT